ncbi:MAG: indole-3-glycerol-phosphate synthase [Planctomycetota bacterium]
MSGPLPAVLANIVEASRHRAITPPPAVAVPRARSLRAAIAGRESLALLAEWKRRSPSAGPLVGVRDCAEQVTAYAAAGAHALSIVTEPTRFDGDLHDLSIARRSTDLPVLRKDFLTRPEQVIETAAHGASAVLLIARCLSESQTRELCASAREAGLEVLLECHDEREVGNALAIEDVLIGVNNRDLDTLTIDRSRAPRLLADVPVHRVTVAESGYRSLEDLREIDGLADAVLIGTALMRGENAANFARGVRR